MVMMPLLLSCPYVRLSAVQVLQRIATVVKMIGSLEPRGQRYPADTAVRCDDCSGSATTGVIHTLNCRRRCLRPPRRRRRHRRRRRL